MKHYLSLKNVWVTLFMLTIAASMNAQTLPWTYTNTGVNHTILIQPGTVTINGTPISNGDYVGVFFDLSGTLTCGGFVEYTGGVTALSAWGSEAGVDNGFQNLEAFSWKVWVASTGAVVDMVATYSFGGGFYTTNAMSGILTLEGTAGPSALSASYSQSNVSCFGLCDGSIDVTVSDGTTPYSYLWSNGATSEDLSGVCAGLYTVTVSDASDNVVLNITITEPSEIILTDIATNANCNGTATGAIDLTLAGGSSPFTYAWSNGASSEDLTGILAGSYSITVTDDNGCTGSALFTVGEPTALTLIQNNTNILCFGNTTGAIDITVGGGTAPYSYSWNNSSTNEDLTNLGAGNYSVTITDGNNCTISNSYTITEPTELGATATTTDVLCNGGATGSVDLTVTGGTMPYTFSWTNGASSEDLANVMAGTYAYTVTDANGCMFTGSAQVSEPAALLASSSITNVDCYGNQNGAINLTISGGVTPYSIVWSNQETTEDLAGLGPGLYDVLVFDVNNCPFTDDYTISEPAQLTVTPIFSDYSGYNVSANGASDGLIDVTVFGGVSPYTFAWSNGGSTNSVAGLAAGTHSLTVTDALACTIVESYTLTEPAPIGFGATGLVGNATCFGVCDGSIDLTVVGGTTPYIYNWSNGASVEDISGLCAGTYDVTVTDASGGAPVYQPFDWSFVNTGNNHTILISTGVVTIDGSPIQPMDVIGVFYNSGGNMVCAGYITWAGAPTACTAWGSEAGLNNGFQNNEAFNWKVWRAIQGDVVDMTATYLGIPFTNQGNYITNGMSGVATLTGTPSGGGGGGVSIIESFTVTEPAELLVSGMATNNLCHGGTTGSIDLSVTGGTLPYSFNWSNSAMTEDISGLAAGYYDVIVSDANQCSATFGVTITQPTELMATAVATNAACFGDMTGSVDLTVSGGTMPYSYNWSNGGATEDLPLLGAGSYLITVTDDNGCTYMTSATVNQPVELAASGMASDVSCYNGTDGSIDLTVSGGVSPYTYMWSNGGQSQDLVELSAGTYGYTVTDANNCMATGSVLVSQPDVLAATGVVSDYNGYSVSLYGASDGSIDLSVTGGTMPYYYSWSNGATTQDLLGLGAGTYDVTVGSGAEPDLFISEYIEGSSNNKGIEIYNPKSTPVNLSDYLIGQAVNGGGWQFFHVFPTGAVLNSHDVWVIITDQVDPLMFLAADADEVLSYPSVVHHNGDDARSLCHIVGNDTIIIDQFGNPDLDPGSGWPVAGVADATKDHTLLRKTTITAGNTNWMTSFGTDAANSEWVVSTVNDFSDLGNFSANYCVATASFTLTQPNPSSTLQISAAITHVACNGNATGAIDLSISGGTAPYSVEWSNSAMTEDISGLVAGTYMVTVVDLGSTTVTGSFTVNQATAIGAVESITDVMCNGALTGSIVLTVSGGTAPYIYSWSNGATTKDIMSVGAGMYDVTITDANMCVYFGSYMVSGPAALMATEAIVDILCNGLSTGSIDMTISGGVAPYSFAWSNGATMEDIAGLMAGTYSVTITDGNQCSYIGNYSVTEPAAIMATEAITNVMCNGILSGGIDLSVTGGVGAYTFAWSNGATNEDIIAIGAGTYEVTIADANQCEYYGSYMITEPAAISAMETITNVLCNGASTGAIDLMVSGGVAPFTFSWSNSETTEDISGLMAGTYSVIITDANNCVYVGNYSLTEPAVLDATEAIVEVLCNGAATGSINLAVSGGVTPYDFAWSNSAMSEDLMNIMAGMYDVTITDANGCEYMNSYTISEPAELMVSETIVNIMCNGDANGSIDLTVSGGIAPYTFAWSNSAMSEDLINLNGGTYGVTITDFNGCEFIGSYDVLEPAALVVAETLTNVLCNGDATGAIDLTVSGGVAPHSFMWSTSDVSEDLSNLVAGTYDVTVTDANGCTWMASFTITEPDAIGYGMTSSDPLCAGNPTGYINIFVSGGVSPFTFLWSNGSSDEDLSGVVAGSYSLTVTDANGCTLDFATSISEPAALSVNETISNIDCYGGNNGMIEVVAAGGVGPYAIVWASAETTFTLANLMAGTYDYTVTDFNMCEYYGSAVVTEPGLFVANGVVTDVTCFGGIDGIVDLSVVGGTAPFAYLWSDGSTNEDLMAAAGTYTVDVTDVNGCTASASFTINEPAGMSTTGVVIDAMIYGGNQGSIDITVAGGSAPYSFVWSNGAFTNDISGLIAGDYYVTVTDLSNCFIVDMYSVGEPAPLSGSGMVSDFNGYGVSCFGSTDGSIDLTILGGTPPYDFEWSNGETTEDISGLSPGTYDVTVSYTYGTGPTGTPFNWVAPNTGANHTLFIPDAQINGTTLNPGDYVGVFFDQSGVLVCGGYVEWTGVSGGTAVTAWGAESGMDNGFQDGEAFIWKVWRASDQQTIDMVAVYAPIFPNMGTYSTNGISGLVSLSGTSTFFSVYEDVMLSFTITEPSEIMLAGATTDVLCFGDMTGAIDLTITGGVMPYVVEWSNGAMSEDISGLASGMYTATVTDANGCMMTGMYEIFQNALLENSGIISNVKCNGGTDGSVDLSVMGGTMPYSFLWSNGETTEDIAGLVIGTYTVTVSDANSCMAYGTFVVDQPAMLTKSAIVTGVSCYGGNNGAINLTVLGGMTPYTYLWASGNTNEDRTGLTAGTYSFTATDANNCTISGSYTVAQNPAIILTSSISHVTCNSYQNGSINLTVAGGTTPYTYYWSNSSINEDVSGLGAGGYSVMVTDYNGCSASALYFINQPAAINITGVITNVSCNGFNDGAINVSVSGGTSAYSYIWSNAAITQDLSGVTAGSYTITVSDVNTCSKNRTFIVTQPAPLNVTAVKTNVSCNGANNGSVDQTVSGGTAPYTYNWSNGGTAQDKFNLPGGTYFATVTDTKGCSVINTYIITEPAPLASTNYISTYGAYNVSANGASNGFIVLFPSGGTFPYQYTWANGTHSYYRLNLAAGNYSVTITDLNGCSMVQSFTLTQPAAYTPVTIIPTVTSPQCNGSTNGAINLAISNGVSPYTYLWNNGSTSKNRSGLAAGTYTVSVTDATAATQTLAVIVTQPDPIVPTYVVNNVSCNGMANGAIDLSVTGGTTPYTYNWGMSVMQDLSNLVAGVYTVTIKDVKLCTAVQSVTVNQPTMLALAFTVTDPLCDSDGNIDLAVTGGTTPYAYLWSNGSTDEDPGSLMAGTYTVDVTDANGCMANGSADVSMSAQLQVALVGTDITCYGAHNGMVDLTIAGGVMPYSFAWDNSSTDEDLINLAAGTLIVTVSDANSCSVTGTVTISEPVEIVLSAVTSNVTCNGGMNGSIDLTVTGGIMPYSYIWANGATTKNRSNLMAGTYMVTVTDANACMKVETYIITEPAPIAMTYTATNLTCYKMKDGAITITVTGGTSPYTFLWSNLATTQDLTALKAGNYSVKIWDANNCLFQSPVITITQPDPITSGIALAQGILCAGDQNAALDLTVSGGSTPYSFNWNNGAYSTEDPSGLGAGMYDVVVSDAHSCVTTNTIIVSAPNPLTSQMFTANVSCYGGADGAAAVVMTGGTWPYSFEWSDGLTTIGTNEIIWPLSVGTYNILVTDAHGCTTTNSATITEPDPLGANISIYGTTNLTVLAVPTGGTGPYSYSWQPGNATAPFVKNILPGTTLTVTITDAHGCTYTTTFVAQPTAPTVAGNSGNTSNQNSGEAFKLASPEDLTVVYPNPNNTGVFYVSVPDQESISSMKVYDASGRLISSDYQKNVNGDILLDIQNISKGIYYLRISDEAKRVIVKKLVITQ